MNEFLLEYLPVIILFAIATALSLVFLGAVSYTHLTLPTNREV